MSLVHLHLMTNHIPVIGIIIGLILIIVAMIWKSSDLKRFALYFFTALGIVTLIVFFTGEPAEEAVENIPGISDVALDRHEDASLFGLIAIEITAAVAALGLILRRLRLLERRWYVRALVALVLLSTMTMGWIANLGGKIRHTETSPSSTSGATTDGED